MALALFSVNTNNMDLIRAQLAAYSKQIPLLYFIICANVATVAFTHYGHAPIGLTVFLPSCLVAICAVRVGFWMRARNKIVADEVAVERLRMAVRLGGVVGVVILAWTFSLYAYGDVQTRSHVNLVIGITVMGSIFSLMHLRSAALILAAVVVIPYTTFVFLTQNTTYVLIAINLLLVTGAMVYVLFIVSADFEKMVNGQVETKRLSDDNFRLANTDSLTGLPNRRQFFGKLDALLGRAKLRKSHFVVGVIDLDGFKPINDLYGHVVGDRVLMEVGERLQGLASDAIFFARLGGDEFGVFMEGACSSADILAFGERICDALRTPFSLPGLIVNVTGSIGFAMFPEAGETSEILFERADYALYFGKQKQRGRAVIFTDSHEVEIRNQNLIEQCLRSADLDSEMSLHFQPLFDVVLNRPVSFEALARWHSPKLGSVPPNVFIAVAERTDLINKITRTLLHKALAAAKTWPNDVRVSFNLSTRDLLSPESILQIVSIVRNSGVTASRIDFEVTETAFMGDFDQAEASIRMLKALGARISLDDFGTGYSSLSYVHRLPLDKIKIDRSFVIDIETQSTCRTIVRTVVDLCQSLSIDCVVEGMETKEQASVLRELGCKAMQGYFFSKPMPEGEVASFIARMKPVIRHPEVADVA